ncbi:unnamed protein product [Cyclocybe aegerita]|uniref:F-box domain-containing protein n=1 Tax=Cyclocybe aegerita TaxID=1973307 RepID=A0A8S0W6W7_CYCAE|nr:unnamed protein product [Cyclocybe aegerita]
MAFAQGRIYCEQCRAEVEGERDGGTLGLPGALKQPQQEIPGKVANSSPTTSCCDPCRKIEHLTAQIKQAKAHIAAQMAKSEAHITTLTSQLCAAQTARNALHDPLAQRLPPEIVSYIFYHACPSPPPPSLPSTSPQRPQDFRYLRRAQALVLGAVCKSWRLVAWNTPELWTDVSVHFESELRTGRELKFMEDWFSRSGRLPVSLRLSAVVDYTLSVWGIAQVEEQRRSVVEAISTKHSGRLRTLEVTIPDPLFWDVISELRVGPGLEELSIHSEVRTGAWMMPSLLRSLSTSAPLPAPRTVRVTSVPPTDINISWKNVTHLELQSVEEGACFSILQQAPYVVSCKFLQVLPDSAPPLPSNASSASLPSPIPIVLPCLKYLHYSNSNRPRAFASGFTFPALQELSLTVDGHLPSASLIALLTRSDAPLRTLELIGWTNDDEDGLMGLLRVVSSLQELHLCPSPLNPRGVSERFFQAFSTLQPKSHAGAHDQQKRTTTFLPNLQKLGYQGRVTFSWSVLRCLLPYASSLSQIRGGASNTKEGDMTRSLHTVRLELGMHRTNFIDKDVVLRLLDAQRRFGMVWSISPASQSSDHGMFMNAGDSLPPDLLLASMEHHQIQIEGERDG